MSEMIIREWYFLLYSMLAGIFFAFVYDQIRLLRRLWRHSRLLTDVEDILYWMFCFFASFYFLYYGNHGVVRFFAVLGAAIGMLFYRRTIGRIYVKSLYCVIMFLLAPYRFVKIRLTRIRNHFTIKMRDLMRAKRGEGEKHAAKPCKTKKREACISAKQK